MENQLVVIENNIPLADSRQIATQLGIAHHNVYAMAKEYQSEVEADFGKLLFQTEPLPSGQMQKYVLLTEDQSYVFLAYSKNTEQARTCKRMLVKAFAEARQGLMQLTISPLAGDITPDVLADPRRLNLAIRGARAKHIYLQTEMALRYPERIHPSRLRIRGPKELEERILHVLRRHGPISLNTLHHSYMKNWDAPTIEQALSSMMKTGYVIQLQTERGWIKYAVA